MSWISKFLKLRVTGLSEVEAPQTIVTVDETGLFGTIPFEVIQAANGSEIQLDGGFANVQFTIRDNIEGGSSTQTGITINGGNA